MTIYIGSDHGGFDLKTKILSQFKEEGTSVIDLGAKTFDPEDDYPDSSLAVAKAVTKDPDSLGILICRSGQGVCVVANKVKGIRAALVWNEQVARAGRHDDHTNVLCLPADFISFDQAWGIIQSWLKTSPNKEEKYLRRLEKIKTIENQN